MPGALLLKEEKAVLNRWLGADNRAVMVQIGGPQDVSWVHAPYARVFRVTESPCFGDHKGCSVTAKLLQLPFASDSVDVVLLPHALETENDVAAVLKEAVRIVKPNGQLIFIGLNPLGCWRLCSLFGMQKKFFKQHRFLPTHQIKKNLHQLNCKLVFAKTSCFSPPLNNKQLAEKYLRLAPLMQLLLPFFGAGQMLVAIKQEQGVTALPVFERAKKIKWQTSQVGQTTRSYP